MEKILVTGSSGYLGATVYKILHKTGKVDKLQCRLEQIRPRTLSYDIVIHCAGALRYRTGEHIKSNAEGTRYLIEGLNPDARIVYISSKSVYGIDLEGVFTEETIPEPSDDYGKSKYLGERALLESDHPYIILRASTLFGLGVDNLGPAFPSLVIQNLLLGRSITLFTPDVNHEYLYVWDLAQIVAKLVLKQECWNNIFNISGRARSLHQLIRLILDKHKDHGFSSAKLIETYRKPPKSFFLDSSRIEKVIGKKFNTDDQQVVQKMFEFLITSAKPFSG